MSLQFFNSKVGKTNQQSSKCKKTPKSFRPNANEVDRFNRIAGIGKGERVRDEKEGERARDEKGENRRKYY